MLVRHKTRESAYKKSMDDFISFRPAPSRFYMYIANNLLHASFCTSEVIASISRTCNFHEREKIILRYLSSGYHIVCICVVWKQECVVVHEKLRIPHYNWD